MLDVISGGRIISGFVRGIGIESWANNTNPLHNRERFEECHDLVVKTWTTPGPFRWEGTHYHYRAVNPWMLPIQKPHPPVWVPGTGSPETVEWTARHRYTYAAFLTPLEVAKNLFARYREYADDDGWEPGPEKVCVHDLLSRERHRRKSAGVGQGVPVADELSVARAAGILVAAGVHVAGGGSGSGGAASDAVA